MTETRIISPTLEPGSSEPPWCPQPGEEVRRLLAKKENLGTEEKQAILKSAQCILGKGVNPNGALTEKSKTGLVIGRVQSGKTMSFTTVAALARDNGFPMVIAITGISTYLSSQSEERFIQDLETSGGNNRSRWMVHSNPKENDLLQTHLKEVIKGRAPYTLLVVVMKHYGHLNELVKILNQVPNKNFPTLIIDDEADQASLNTSTKKENPPSKTYKALMDLRKAASPNIFLQYTATPQAPLLINVLDHLSPDYVHLLEPGNGYIAKELLKEPYARVIPSRETAASKRNGTPPSSLVSALQIYLLGVAFELSKHPSSILPPTRSMLVHPSQYKKDQDQYHGWIQSIVSEWKDVLSRIFFSGLPLGGLSSGH